MRQISEIIVHCTATRSAWWKGKTVNQKVAEVRRWHVEDRGWSDIGYHYLIDRSGKIVEGRPVERPGAHVKGHNSESIGICLFGGFGGSENDQFFENFTQEQDISLRELIDKLKDKHGDLNVSGHNEYAAKACPCFNVSNWLKRQPRRTSIAQSRIAQASTLTAVASSAGSVTVAVSQIDPIAQYILIGVFGVVILAALLIFKERLKKWGEGIR